jgi:hypothetical protein
VPIPISEWAAFAAKVLPKRPPRGQPPTGAHHTSRTNLFLHTGVKCVPSFCELQAALTGIHLCHACSCQEIDR